MSMKWIVGGVMLALAATNFGCASVPNPPTVDHVDMSRYSGRWYEVARIPHLFDYFNVADTVTYTRRDHGDLVAVERWRHGTTYGPMCDSVGVLKPGPHENGHLQLQNGLNISDYWVLALDPDYQYAMIGTPDRRYLRILSRTPTLPQDVDEKLFALADREGYDVAQVRRTPQLMQPE